MATKYKKQKNGLYMTRVWDGTYKNGRKHYAMLTSNKSSRDLERKVESYRESVRNRKQVKTTDTLFCKYAKIWLTVYKAGREGNTIRMYRNIIEKHLNILEGIPLQEIDRIHVQSAISHADGRPATQVQIRMTLRQKDPKTKNGFRTIPIPAAVYPAIERYIHDLKAQGNTYLFTMRDGNPVTKSSYVRMWKRNTVCYGKSLRRSDYRPHSAYIPAQLLHDTLLPNPRHFYQAHRETDGRHGGGRYENIQSYRIGKKDACAVVDQAL